MSRSTDTWCWMCGDPINCGVEKATPGSSCCYGPGLLVGEQLKRQREADELRMREIIRNELTAMRERVK